jgi:hypothetical protein
MRARRPLFCQREKTRRQVDQTIPICVYDDLAIILSDLNEGSALCLIFKVREGYQQRL